MTTCKLCEKAKTKNKSGVCDDCFGNIDTNPFRRTAAEIIDYFDSRRGHTTKGERYYELEDEITEILQERLDLREDGLGA